MTARNSPASTDVVHTPAVRFLRNAERCRARELRQLHVLCELMRAISDLIHALQRERGAASIFLGSRGKQFSEQLPARVVESAHLELQVRGRLDLIEDRLDGLRAGARFYTRLARVFTALDTLSDVRARTTALTLAPQQAMHVLSDVIAQLLAVGFEAADIATDPETASVLVALVSFAQGKEYAGQERATAGVVFSRGVSEATEHDRLLLLRAAQERAFQVFARFAREEQIALAGRALGAVDATQFARLRAASVGLLPPPPPPQELTAAWYDLSTRRIDAMKSVEDQLAADLGRLCATKVEEAQRVAACSGGIDEPLLRVGAPMVMVVAEVDQGARDTGLVGGLGLYTLDDTLPEPLHSILDVVAAQARLIDDVSGQLQTARSALSERKTIERAKGLLMRSRKLSEQAAYELIRRTAMRRSKRLVEVAEAIIGAAASQPARTSSSLSAAVRPNRRASERSRSKSTGPGAA